MVCDDRGATYGVAWATFGLVAVGDGNRLKIQTVSQPGELVDGGAAQEPLLRGLWPCHLGTVSENVLAGKPLQLELISIFADDLAVLLVKSAQNC